MSIDDPIKEQIFKSIISVIADTRADAKNILTNIESKYSISFDTVPGFGEGESNYQEQLPLTKMTLPSGQVVDIGANKQ